MTSKPLQLFILGDSLSQGFLSGRAAASQFSYGTWLARAIGLEVGKEFQIPDWPCHGIGVDVEAIYRYLEPHACGKASQLQLPTTLRAIAQMLDESETYYERGPGSPELSANQQGPNWFHNTASFGFEIADSWLVTPAICKAAIQISGSKDNWFSPASAMSHRSALRVLNPNNRQEYDDHSQVVWLKQHAKQSGIKRVIAWLGANNAVAAITSLQIRETEGDTLALSSPERREKSWSLWTEHAFEREFEMFLGHLDTAMQQNKEPDWRVYLGTLPSLSSAGLVKGFGDRRLYDRVNYRDVYTWFLCSKRFIEDGGPHLTRDMMQLLDARVAAFNRIMRTCIKSVNKNLSQQRWILVETGACIDNASWDRTAGHPSVPHAAMVKSITGRRLDGRYPNRVTASGRPIGGLTSLDGVHPSVLGQAVLADVFLTAMKEQHQASPSASFDWQAVIASDTVWQDPPHIATALRLVRRLGGRTALSLMRSFRLLDHV